METCLLDVLTNDTRAECQCAILRLVLHVIWRQGGYESAYGYAALSDVRVKFPRYGVR